MGIDPHLRLTCRTFSLNQPLALIWKQVYVRHGPFPEKAGDNVTVEAFRKKFLRELMKIKRAWPELSYTTEPARALILHPTPALIPAGQKAGRPRLSVRLMSPPSYPASLQVTAGPPALPYRFTAPSFS